MDGGRSAMCSPTAKARFRAIVAIALLLAWALTGATGWLIWLAPEGPRSGQITLLLGLVKREWGEVHFLVSAVASILTVIHVVVDWRALRGCVRHLTSMRRQIHIQG
ncbi:MAG: DUF4405 domain-containing protein [Chloroflexota bacterium]